jgi:hypothetical protein
MYEGWRIERWDTQLSDRSAVLMVSLVDEKQLTVTVEDTRSPKRERWQFVFARYPAYRNILEEHRMGLWHHLDQSGQRCGYTFIVLDSPWIESFRPQESLLDAFYPTLKHYVIATDDDVIEVLSPEPPLVVYLGSAPQDAPMPGKSNHLYYPKDKQEIEQMVQDIIDRNQQPQSQ